MIKVGTTRRWAMLLVSMLAQVAGSFFTHGIAFAIPALQSQSGLTLTQAGVVVAMPTLGVVLSLIAWGVAVDRFGERGVLVGGATLTAAAGAAAAFVATQAGTGGLVVLSVLLFVGGMAAASSNAASGRVVVGWFPPQRRGLAMGIRQTAQPLGVGMAAVTVPVIAGDHGLGASLWLPTGLLAAAALACLLVVIDPPRPDRASAEGQLAQLNPYAKNRYLWRIHCVSVLLVVPQFTVWTFALVWLLGHGWEPGPAGLLIAATQVLGALGRIAVGQWSDRLASRMRPLRWVAVAAALTMIIMAALDQLGSPAAVVLLVIATVITVADNGLAFTGIAERAGPFWSGRALGTQNTAQFLAASLVPPVLGGVIMLLGFPVAFALTGVVAGLAAPLVPVRQEKIIS